MVGIEKNIDIEEKAKILFAQMTTRRSCRAFSDRDVPDDVIKALLAIASSAPSGANKQPWTFVSIRNPEMKRRIREAAEAEEKAFYGHRATKEWKKDLEFLNLDWQKPFLEEAPVLIAVFAQKHGIDGSKHYYVQESVGLASGFLISALHQAGLSTVTHTPSPMQFLAEILDRPKSEKPFLLLPIGYPADDYVPPPITRKVDADYHVRF